MQTTIYACYLPGSTKPDYIGSHSAQPHDSSAAQWRYNHCTYLGQGCWIDKEGIIIAMPRNNRNTEWGKLLLLMSAAERLAIRVEVLAQVRRAKTEAKVSQRHGVATLHVTAPAEALAALEAARGDLLEAGSIAELVSEPADELACTITLAPAG